MKRGEVWRADLAAPAGRRAALLVSRNEACVVRELATVAPATTRILGNPPEVPLEKQAEPPQACVANLDSLTTFRSDS